MNPRDREKIDRCVDKIITILDMTILWPYLIAHGIYNKHHVNISIWEQNLNDKEIMKDILLTIKTRGPDAYQNLLKSLRKCNYENVVDMLENLWLPLANNNCSEIDNKPSEHDDRIDKNDDFNMYDPSQAEEPIKVHVLKATEFLDRRQNQTISAYPMRSKIRGLVLIITLIDYPYYKKRDAAEHDERNLKELFEQMGFNVTTCRDKSVPEIKEYLRHFARNKQFDKADSCFVIISGHGDRSKLEYQTVMVDKYENEITIGEILRYFTAQGAPILRNKPKVFIFQICRGKKEQNSVALNGKNINEDNEQSSLKFDDEGFNSTISDIPSRIHIPGNESIRNYDDMLIAHSTLPGHVSYRDKKTGSWYIQLLCAIFMYHARDKHVHDLFVMVDQRLKELRNSRRDCQTSTMTTIGFKHLYINPGLFEEE